MLRPGTPRKLPLPCRYTVERKAVIIVQTPKKLALLFIEYLVNVNFVKAENKATGMNDAATTTIKTNVAIPIADLKLSPSKINEKNNKAIIKAITVALPKEKIKILSISRRKIIFLLEDIF